MDLKPTPPVRINWEDRVVTEFEFKTATKRSFNGTEQRSALRAEPRVTIRHGFANLNGRSVDLLDDLAHRPDDIFALPVPWRTALVAARNFYDFRLQSVPFWATPGTDVVVESETDVAQAQIVSVTGDTVRLDTDPIGVFPEGSRMSAAYRARMEPSTRVDFLTDEVSVGEMTWVAEPGAGRVISRPTTPETFNGRAALLERPDWAGEPRFQQETRRKVFDPLVGRTDTMNPHRFYLATSQFVYTELTQERVDRLISFFIRQKGKRSSFYMPTWRSDIPHDGTDSNGDIIVRGERFHTIYKDHVLYAAIAVFLPGGPVHLTRIQAVSRYGQNTLVKPETPLPRALEPGVRVSWLPRVRFASDRLSVEWLSGEVGQMSVPVTPVPFGG